MNAGWGLRRAMAVAVLALVVIAAPAAAHVDVLPTSVVAGESTEFTVRVPTERALPTTGVRVEFPDSIVVYSFAPPPPGWTMRPVLGGDGRFQAVEYRGRSGVGRYVDFRMLGTPSAPGVAVWRARQTYADGLVKPWTGPPEVEGAVAAETGPTDPGPAAQVSVLAEGEAAAVATGDGGGDGESGAAIWLGVIAIAISAFSLLALGFLWSTRPAKLPEDR